MDTNYLLLDDDGDFTNGGTQFVDLTQNGTNREAIFTPSAAISYLTFATRPPDTTPPLVVLSGEVAMTLLVGEDYLEEGATWTDDYDGAGTIDIASSGSVDTSTLGTYTLKYRYTDEAGNQSNIVTRTVNVMPIPAITGSVSYSITGPTNQDVIATLTLNMSGSVLSSGWNMLNTTTATKTYTSNVLLEAVLFQNDRGYTGVAMITIP
jgi:hypothetical protein